MPELKSMPIIKWVGGKRQLLNEIKLRMPKTYDTYYEPFFGGGALFFELQPQTAVINDFNEQLINMYQQIQKDYKVVIRIVDQYQNTYNLMATSEQKLEYYYFLRKRFNTFLVSNKKDATSAALFIFLNKAGFNGLYRVNSNGEFNVPSAHRDKINGYQLENVQAVASCLSGTKILQGDFEDACKDAKRGDFVFFDSPYYDTFDTYQAGGFDEDSHKRLALLFKNLSDKGVNCMLTNSNTDFIKDLYSAFNISIIDVKRMINCDASKRTGQEVIITNYKGGE